MRTGVKGVNIVSEVKKIRKAYLYQRFSSEKQRGNSSTYRQTLAQEKWLSEHPDVVVVKKLLDDGLSATKGEQISKGSLGRLVAQIELGAIERGSLILVEHFSRITRFNIDKSEELVKKIWRGGVTIVTVIDGKEYTPEALNDISTRVLLMFEFEKAFAESEWHKKKIKSSYDKRENEAKLGEVPNLRKPFWLDKNGKLNEKHEIIVDVFKWYLSGLGQSRIYQNITKKYPDAFEKLNPTSIVRWLKSESAIGYWVRNNGNKYKVYEPAISDDIFYQAKSINIKRLHKNVKPRRNFALHGLIECGHCGGGTTIQRSYHRHALPLIRCSTQRRLGKDSCTYNSTFPYAVAYYYFIELVRPELIRNLSDARINKDESKELNIVEVKLIELNRKYKKMNERFATAKEQEEDLLLDSLSKISKDIKLLEQKRADVEFTLNNKKTYISDDVADMEKDPELLNLNFIRLQRKMIIKNDTIYFEFEDGSSKIMRYVKYCQKNKAYLLDQNFILMNDLLNPEISADIKKSWEDDSVKKISTKLKSDKMKNLIK